MKNLLMILLFYAVSVSVVEAQTDFYGTWKIYEYRFADISGMTSKQAQDKIGERIFLEKGLAVLPLDSCRSAVYRVRRVNANTYLEHGYKTSAKSIGLNDMEVDVVDIFCGQVDNAPDFDLIFLDKETSVINQDGVFFWMKKINN